MKGDKKKKILHLIYWYNQKHEHKYLNIDIKKNGNKSEVTDMSEELGGFGLIHLSLNGEGKHVSYAENE